MFKSFQDTSALQQFHGFPNLNMQQATSAYGFSGVTFWLDAAYGLNTQTNLGAVSRWQARVGGAIFEQTTAGNQPRLILNDANYNNLPSVETISNARFMSAAIGNRFRYFQDITIVVVSKVNSQASAANAILGTSTAEQGLHDGGGFSYTGFGVRIGGTFVQGNTETSNPRIKILTRTNVIINGANEVNITLPSSPLEFDNLFRFNDSGSNLIGTIAEIIAFGYSMTSDEAIALSNNLNQKYAIY